MGYRPPSGGDLPPDVVRPLHHFARGVDPTPFGPSRPDRAGIIAALALGLWLIIIATAALIMGRL